MNGVHWNANGKLGKKLKKAYQLNGIPHYSLINKEGIIVEINAPRPSEETSYKLLFEQL